MPTTKQNLTQANDQLFRRSPDEVFPTLQALWERCHSDKERSTDRWRPPSSLRPKPDEGRLTLDLGEGNEPFWLNDWSFTQLCALAGVSKETVNRLSPDTAGRVFAETCRRATSRCRSSPRTTRCARSTGTATRGSTTPTW